MKSRTLRPLRHMTTVLVVVLLLAAPAAVTRAGKVSPNFVDAFSHLNLTQADASELYNNRSYPLTDVTAFRFAASLDPPTISPEEEPWGMPILIGGTFATWPADTIPSFPTSPEVINNALYLPHGGPTPGTEYLLMWAQMNGPIPIFDPMELFQNWSFPIRIPGEPVWEPLSQYPYDTWGMASTIPYITYGPQPWMFALSVVQPDGSLADMDFNGFGLIANDLIIVGVDTDSLLNNGPAGLTYSFAGHIHDGGYGASPKSQSLVTFATGTPGNLVPVPDADQLVVAQTVPPTTSTSSTSTTSTTTTTLPETPGGATDGTPPPSGEAGGGFPGIWIPIFIFGGIVIGVWIYYRTRERGKPETGGGVTPPPPAYGVVPGDHHANCDWALYFNNGGTREVLRPANGHECCVYDIEVKTSNPVFELAAKGRQDAVNPQGEGMSPDERLRMFDYDMWSDGPNVSGYASTRTGPTGTLDWMQGLGDPKYEAGWKATGQGDQHMQQKPLEEPVDAGVSLRYEGKTTLSAILTPDCPEYENTYTLDAKSNVFMAATQECTNGEPGPECPIELTASGIVDASVGGDVNYPLVMKAATYPDELERKSPPGLEGPVGGIDSHDHATRPRSTWEDSDAKSGGNVVKKDATTLELTSLLHLDSGQIVPMETWDTTERVSTDIEANLDHKAEVQGEMVTDCDQGCGGHGECNCAPSFKLKVDGAKGTLEVDGQVFDIERSWFTEEWVLS